MSDYISEHFKRHEFACKCGCGYNTVDTQLVEILKRIRWKFKRPVIINSGCRCPEYNAKVGGAKRSQHMQARAADIIVDKVSPNEVHAYLDKWWEGGLGKYDNFTHIDTRDKRARW